jgi:hypothetical protein
MVLQRARNRFLKFAKTARNGGLISGRSIKRRGAIMWIGLSVLYREYFRARVAESADPTSQGPPDA